MNKYNPNTEAEPGMVIGVALGAIAVGYGLYRLLKAKAVTKRYGDTLAFLPVIQSLQDYDTEVVVWCALGAKGPLDTWITVPGCEAAGLFTFGPTEKATCRLELVIPYDITVKTYDVRCEVRSLEGVVLARRNFLDQIAIRA